MKCLFLSLFITISFLAKSQAPFSQPFGAVKLPGHYWDKEGNRHEGVLKLKFSTTMGAGTTVKFYQNGENKGRLETYDMESFVYGRDSFALLKNINISDFKSYDKDFAMAIEIGKLNLFLHRHKIRTSTGNTATVPMSDLVTTYIIQMKGDSSVVVINNIKTFKENFLPLIKDDQELTNHILAMNKKSWLSNLSRFVWKYNHQ